MLEQQLPAVIALGAACIAIYTDMKERIIPNKLTYPLIGAGIVYYLLLGAWRWDFWVAVSGALGAALSFGIAYVLWLTGGWAGGDVKFFTALGALLPVYQTPFVGSAPYPFPITILFNSVLAMLPILAVYGVFRKSRGLSVFYDEMKITELKEGVIPAELIYEKGGKILRGSSRLGLKPSSDKIYADPSRAAGLTRHQVGALKRLVKRRKLENRIKLKRGMPFAPALGAGTFIGVVYGDIYWAFLSAISIVH